MPFPAADRAIWRPHQSSGLGIPLVAVGLFYTQGYFKQQLDSEGYQLEEYIDTKVEKLPIHPAVDASGSPVMVSIDTRSGRLLAKVWRLEVGRVTLFLLDCNVEGNSPEDRHLTSRLYGGDHRTRIRQELVLGVGGVRALRSWAFVRACTTERRAPRSRRWKFASGWRKTA